MREAGQVSSLATQSPRERTPEAIRHPWVACGVYISGTLGPLILAWSLLPISQSSPSSQVAENNVTRLKRTSHRTCLEEQWLRLWAPNTGDPGLIPGQGTKIPHVTVRIPHTTAKTWHNQTNKYFQGGGPCTSCSTYMRWNIFYIELNQK